MSNYKLILRKCKQRERRAQLEFYMLFYKKVYSSCIRILGNPQESEEVMQEVFLKVFSKSELFCEDETDMLRLLKRIAINRSLDIYRQRKIEFVELTENYNYLEEETEEEEINFRLTVVKEGMKKLPEGYKIILSLHLLEGLEYNEIAEQLQISPSGVRSQYARAKQKLTEIVYEYSKNI